MILSVRYFASRSRSGCEKPFRPTCCFNGGKAARVSREGQRRCCCGRGTACFAQRVVELIRSSRCTAKEPPRLRRMGRLFVRRTQSNQVLRVKCAEGCHDSGSDPDDAFFHAWPKHGDPKVAAKKQLGTAHGGRAAGMGRAIMLHLFDRRCCIIHHPTATGVLTISVHLPLQRVSA
jgi:hypothetical protein